MEHDYNIMDKNRGVSVVVLVLLVLGLFSFSIANANTNRVSYDDDEDESNKSCYWLWERFRRAYSMYSSIFPTTSVGQYWNMVKAVVNNTYAYFFPPNIERGDEVEAVMPERNGAMEKVKEAFSKSIGRSKSSLEGGAKSAADITGETIGEIKRSFSGDDREDKKHLKKL